MLTSPSYVFVLTDILAEAIMQCYCTLCTMVNVCYVRTQTHVVVWQSFIQITMYSMLRYTHGLQACVCGLQLTHSAVPIKAETACVVLLLQ